MIFRDLPLTSRKPLVHIYIDMGVVVVVVVEYALYSTTTTTLTNSVGREREIWRDLGFGDTYGQ